MVPMASIRIPLIAPRQKWNNAGARGKAADKGEVTINHSGKSDERVREARRGRQGRRVGENGCAGGEGTEGRGSGVLIYFACQRY